MQTKQSKITNAQVTEIRRDYAAGVTQGALARRFRISVNHIGRIVRGEVHQDIPDVLDSKTLEIRAAESLAKLQQMLADAPPASGAGVEQAPERASDKTILVSPELAERARAFGAVHVEASEGEEEK